MKEWVLNEICWISSVQAWSGWSMMTSRCCLRSRGGTLCRCPPGPSPSGCSSCGEWGENRNQNLSKSQSQGADRTQLWTITEPSSCLEVESSPRFPRTLRQCSGLCSCFFSFLFTNSCSGRWRWVTAWTGRTCASLTTPGVRRVPRRSQRKLSVILVSHSLCSNSS